ncbi:MAG TPA: IS1380 family transposase [Gemmataceae bacterium]|nr:IS1380 family transposase [Gemmataceae bacterium]
MSSQGAQQLSFDFLPDFPVIVQPSVGQMSSDAGLLPLRQFDQRWNYTARMAQCLFDPKPSREQSLDSMLRQRIFGIVAGYEDCNDHDTLRDDPVFKVIADRLPEDKALASQPTLSRFENLATPAVLQKLIDFLIDTGIERLKQKHGGRQSLRGGSLPASLTLDLDATDDPTHGHQQLTLFHGYFGQYQYFPLIISEATTKHVFVAWLRPGTVHAALGAEDDLMRVVNALRAARPDIAIHVRGDAGFGLPKMYEVCEENGLTYTFGFSTNARLKKLTEGLVEQAVERYEQSKQKQRLFECFPYQAETWDRTRTVVAKAECHQQGTNLRFVVTNRLNVISSDDGQREYDDYTQRGESEQRMDEMKNGLHMDRLSCHRFMANFFRLVLHTAAMNLLNAARDDKTLPEVLRVGQPCTWRTHVIKVAAVIVQSTRRILVKLAAHWPWWPLYQAVGKRSLNFSCGP